MLTRPIWGKRRARLQPNNDPFDQSLLADYASLLLSNTFSKDLVEMLPEEIVLEIAKQLEPMRLLAIRESRVLVDRICREPPPTKISMDLSAVIYGSTLSFRGHSYISKISNRPNENGDLRKLKGRLRTDECRVLISFDEIGVRGIRTFGPEASTIPVDGSPWYRVVQPSLEAMFECITNGLILQDIYPKSLPNIYDLPKWDTPNPPTVKSPNFFSPSSTHVSHSRFKYVPLGAESCMLTVYCRTRKILDICAHHLAKPHTSCNVERNFCGKNVVRLCFPLNAGEKIQGLWIRTPKPTSIGERTVIIQTTRSRVRTFGLYSGLDRERYDYRPLLHRGDDFVRGIYYNALNSELDCVAELGVVCDPLSHGLTQTPILPDLPSFLDAPTSSRDWYLSTASLHNLRGLTFCYGDDSDPSSCIGVSLLYHDDTRDALGQVCWDCLVSRRREIPRGNTRYRNLKIVANHYVKWTVVESDTEHPNDADGGWKTLPENGTIRWWFGRLGNRIVVDPD